MSILKHLKKCYNQDIGFFSVPEGQRIIQPYISKQFTASIWAQDLVYYYFLNSLHFLDPRQQLEGSFKIGSVCHSIHLSVCPGIGIVSFFLNFGMVLQTYMKLCMTTTYFAKKKFWPTKLSQKQDFLNLLKYLVINFY